MKLPIFETVLRGINIEGSIIGTHRDVEDLFKLHTLGHTRVLRETVKIVRGVRVRLDDAPAASGFGLTDHETDPVGCRCWDLSAGSGAPIGSLMGGRSGRS